MVNPTAAGGGHDQAATGGTPSILTGEEETNSKALKQPHHKAEDIKDLHPDNHENGVQSEKPTHNTAQCWSNKRKNVNPLDEERHNNNKK